MHNLGFRLGLGFTEVRLLCLGFMEVCPAPSSGLRSYLRSRHVAVRSEIYIILFANKMKMRTMKIMTARMTMRVNIWMRVNIPFNVFPLQNSIFGLPLARPASKIHVFLYELFSDKWLPLRAFMPTQLLHKVDHLVFLPIASAHILLCFRNMR